MSAPILFLTVQAVVLSIVSSLLAQLLTALRIGISPFPLDYKTIFKFMLFTAMTTPPNVLWQDYLERSLPGMVTVIPPRAPGVDAAIAASSPTRRLHVPNTLAKTLLDQSAGACVNTLAFCLFMAFWDGDRLVQRMRADFLGLLMAGWRFWPAVSLGNFAFVRDVATRNLVGGLAGIAWGVYVNLFAAAAAGGGGGGVVGRTGRGVIGVGGGAAAAAATAAAAAAAGGEAGKIE